MSDNIRQIRIRVEGRVQGVFFRATTQEKALACHIAGYAKNLSDGSVEILAQGKKDDVEKFLAWVQKGPPLARIDQVTPKDEPISPWLTGFTIDK